MKKHFELFLFLIVIVLLFFAVQWMRGEETSALSPSSASQASPNHMDAELMRTVLQTDNELLEMLLNGASLQDPSSVTSAEREKLPAIFKGLPDDLYKTEVKYGDQNLLVLFDYEKVWKKVNLMQMSI